MTPQRLLAALALVYLPVMAADWNKEAAAAYLDSRQKEWFAWPAAKTGGAACVSCHTGMTYMLARPVLRGASSEPTEWERGLRESLRSRIAIAKDPIPKVGVEAIMAVLFLPENDGAWERLWNLQIKEGPKAGSWPWFDLKLDPYEMPESSYFGTALAARAVGLRSREYRERPEVKPRVDALVSYLQHPSGAQPLHNRLAVLWASAKFPEVITAPDRAATLEALWKAQSTDGGWTLESLGPWQEHRAAPPQTAGSHVYATAWAAMVLSENGIQDARLEKARSWLRVRQDRASGAWKSTSMNKAFEPGSMMASFMDDAATAWAVMALQ